MAAVTLLIASVVLVSASGQPTSAPTCSRSTEDTRCLIDFISQIMSQQGALLEHIRREIPQSTCPTQVPCDTPKRPRNCKDVQRLGNVVSGVYTIHPFLLEDPVDVYCDMYTDGGGWTVFQRRRDGSVNFTRMWDEYRDGFGNLDGEHWLGNTYLHALTNFSAQEMRVDLGDWNDNRVYAKYGRFHVASELDGYRLALESYSGTAGGDSFSVPDPQFQNGHKFSTIDNDQDMHSSSSCALTFMSGFWFNGCFGANLNSPYRFSSSVESGYQGIIWYHFSGSSYSLKFSEMKIRPL